MYLPQQRNIPLDNLESFSLHSALVILENGDFEERWAIAKVLVKYGDDVIEPLKGVILDEHQESEYRWFALKIISQLDNPEIVLIISELLGITEDEDLIVLGTQILASQGERAISILTSLLDSPQYRLCATKALAQIPHGLVIRPLLSVVNDDSVQIRQSAIASLSNFDNPSIIPILENALTDYNSAIRKEALIGLIRKSKYYSPLQLTNVISPYLEDIDLTVCQQSAICLSHIPSQLTTDILFSTLIKPYTPIPLQDTIIKALAWQETSYSLYALEKALYLVSEEICCEIIAILGRINKPKIKEIITKITLKFYRNHELAKKSDLIIQNLCYTWQQMEAKESVDILINIVNIGDEKSKIYAQSALQQLNKIT
ncbi:HEAT repeat domain-containing protein [Cyanobacterium stanieri LEGE 03274]|uniref:HEAT repeat domain-containing protein n=1 Tax=Cyanobacterium stanieri LEGE 03274 TaxID=1828756 RepID=A0ABR9V0Z1_9CHRO|nr:HEAT repeat domain-containing protein [Cyanobacterium stanieri]MBE9221540.1 HEAT repeat domain-containing protein [Cyanobacterium stanieri LEGE 03274]